MNAVVELAIAFLFGVLASSLAGNSYLRFSWEKKLRSILGLPCVSIWLTGFEIKCEQGRVLLYCLELKSRMLLTPTIPDVYFMSTGPFLGHQHAFKPFVYFRPNTESNYKQDRPAQDLIEEWGREVKEFSPYTPGLTVDITKGTPTRVGVLCELIDDHDLFSSGLPLNHVKILGQLNEMVADPMPVLEPGAEWTLDIISEVYGSIETIKVEIPEDLNEQPLLGDSVDVVNMGKRPTCLLDIGLMYTWPLRLKINDKPLEGALRGGGIKRLKIQ